MSKRTIKLKKYFDVIEEYVAGEAITPGQLLRLHTDGKAYKHNVPYGNAVPLFALEDELQGKGIEENYASGDPVQVWVAQRGEHVYARLRDNETIVVGDFLESDGAGQLRKAVATIDIGASSTTFTAPLYKNSIVAQALEAVDLSGSSGTYPTSEFRIKVRIV